MKLHQSTARTAGLLLILIISLLLAACTVPTVTPAAPTDTPSDTPVIEEATDTPAPVPTDTPEPEPSATPAPEPTTALISGRISYPSEGIPPLRIYALESDGDFVSLNTAQNQTEYELELPPGTYTVFAYAFLDDPTPFGGGYTAYSVCGIDASCPDDHELVEIVLQAGDSLDGIDISDWYGQTAGGFPPPPDAPVRPEILPAPLYTLSLDGQIMRLERDGVSASQITATADPITDFDVSPVTGEIAYVTLNELHLTDAFGGNDRVLFSGPDIADDAQFGGPGQIHYLQFSPGGGRIAFALEGVQVIDLASGEVTIVQTNEPSDSPGAGVYFPVAWSPDGSRLLIERAFYTTSGLLQVHSIGFDSVTTLGTGCCHPAWSPDGQFVYVSGPSFGPRVETGLRRHDLYQDGAKEVLIGLDLNSDSLTLVDFARVLADGNLYSFQRLTTKSEYSQMNGLPDFRMVRSDPDGVSNQVELRDDSHRIIEVLWAEDGSGAVISERLDPAQPAAPLLWLPVGSDSAIPLPPTMPASYDRHLRWGATDEALAAQSLKTQFAADLGVTLAAEGTYDGFEGVNAFPLTGVDAPLWAAHTTGMRSFGTDNDMPHQLAIYLHENGWQLLASTAIGDTDNPEDPGADYMYANSVQQAPIEPQNIWLTVDAGVGAHSGTFHLYRFDGEALVQEAAGFSSSPGVGGVADINGDGTAEVLLDASDYYVFCYACGVRYIHTAVLRWDGEHMIPVELTPLVGDSQWVELNNLAVAQAEAGLWKDALDSVGLILAQSADDESGTVAWNVALIQLNGGEKATVLADDYDGYPILENLFFGDYEAAVEPFRAVVIEEIFAQPSALISDIAAGWEDSIATWVFNLSDQALPMFGEDRAADAAAAHFLRAWAAYIVNPADPAVMENISLSVELAPDDPLYEAAFAYLDNLAE